MIKVALCISTYNWPQALEMCLDSISRQSCIPDEIIICDDGSKEETREVIVKWKNKIHANIEHIWQPDEGFRLAKIRNKGFAISQSDYCIQIDGDLILHKDFVNDHIAFARRGFFTTGSRVLLPEKQTKKVLTRNIVGNTYKKKTKNPFNKIRLPLLWPLLANYYKNKGRYKYYVKGCNMAFWKEDLLRVNGYDENFVGWGREDSELAIRLMNNGVKKRFLKLGGICYHLHHPIVSREMDPINFAMMQDSINKTLIYAEKGMSQYL